MRRQNNCVNYYHSLETEIGIFGRRLHTFREVRLGRIQGLVRLRRIRVKGLKFKKNEAPRSKLRGIKRNSPKPTRLRSEGLRRVHLAIHPCSKLQGILAKANKKRQLKKFQLPPVVRCP